MAGYVQSLWLFIKNNEDQSDLPPAQMDIGPYSILINTKLHFPPLSRILTSSECNYSNLGL